MRPEPPVIQNGCDAKVDARLLPSSPLVSFEVRINGHTEKMPPRVRRAVLMLLERDAGIALQLVRNAPSPLSWSFDPRPGQEHAHDRALRMVLPLLLPRRVIDDLYPFQRAGVAWLLRHDRAILADDMGLGKTIQVIAALRRLYRSGRINSCLVVSPRTLMENWAVETRHWAPELVARRLKGDGFSGTGMGWRWVSARAHIVFASYEEVRNPSDELIDDPPDVIVADEAHRLRKSESLTHQGLRRIETPRLWALNRYTCRKTRGRPCRSPVAVGAEPLRRRRRPVRHCQPTGPGAALCPAAHERHCSARASACR